MIDTQRVRIAFTGYINWRYPVDAIGTIYRQIKWFIQRGLYGYADCDWWGLSWYLSQWMPSALRKYRRGIGYPGYGRANTHKKWVEITEKMAKAFEAQNKLADITDWNSPERKQLEKEWEEGMRLFVRWYPHLWD